MLTVTVRLHGGLERHWAGENPTRVNLPLDATLLELQDRLGIPRGEVGLFLVDGEMRDEAFAPPAGARVDIYPMFGGG